MSRIQRAGTFLGPLYLTSRLVTPSAYLRVSGPHLVSRSFSKSVRHAEASDWNFDPHATANRRRTPGAPLPSAKDKADAVACRKAIDEGESPETFLRSKLDAGTLSKPVAAICLMEANHRKQYEAKLGQAALTWLWDQNDSMIYPDDNDLIYTMVELLVHEGHEEQVWRWIKRETRRSKDVPFFIRFEWRVTALKGLLLCKAKLSSNESLDGVIETYLRASSMPIPEGGAADSWLQGQLGWPHPLRAHERSLSINEGRCWRHRWPNTDIELYERAIRINISRHGPGPPDQAPGQLDRAKVAMYHVRTPNPVPILEEFESALADPGHWLHRLKKTWRLGRNQQAALLDTAREDILPMPKVYGDRSDREGIFTQGKAVQRLPFPKFK